MASDGVSQKAHKQCFHLDIMDGDQMDAEAKGGNGVSHESEHSKTLKELISGENAGEGLEELSSNGGLLREDAGDDDVEFENLGEEVDVLTFGDLYKTSNGRVIEELDYDSGLALESKEQSCNSSPEVIPRDFFRSESRENDEQDQYTLEEPNTVGSVTIMEILTAVLSPTNNNGKSLEVATDPCKQNLSFESPEPALFLESCGLDLNTDVGSEDVDCELSLIPFKPVDRSAPIEAELPSIPLHFECELGLGSSAATSAFHPAATIQLGLNCVGEEEEEEEDPPLLQLLPSTNASMGNIALNEDPSVSDSDPVFTIFDSSMAIDIKAELSTRAFVEESTPSSSNRDPDLNLNSGMMRMENGSSEEGCLLHLFMPESRNLLEEEKKTLKRKEPDTGWEPPGVGYNQLRLKL